ncbi:MAG: valine--tRNA ligase [Paracoccaceae bacterium]
MPLDKSFDPAAREGAIRQAWDDAGAFRAGAGKRRDETFSVLIPPPNVTGVLHMGHAFNNTLQDILVRWHRMRGFDTLWQPGLDHAGIATQMVVERQLAAAGEPGRREMGRAKFLNRVWDWKATSGGTIVEQLQRLGASCDWSRTAFTMSGAPGAPAGEEGNFHDAVIRVFVDMYDKGLIYRGKRLVNWDPHFETAISDLEVENREVPGHMWHFKYPLADGATYEHVERDEDGVEIARETRDYISIATTRPETMLGDGAIAVHPSDERYAPIVGQLCEIPVGPKGQRRLIPIITDEYPDKDFGSGAVKITGAHDFNDYQVAKRQDIPLYALMDTKGAMRADGLPYAEAAERARAYAEGAEAPDDVTEVNLVPDAYRGLDRMEARAAIVADITAEGLAVMVPPTDPRLGPAAASDGPTVTDEPPLDAAEGGEMRPDALVPLVEAKAIQQPFGDRSGVVIEPMLTDQWFVDTDKIVGPALDAVRSGDVKILPERDEKVYFHWLENIEPWCISRQLWWGHQIPVWFDESGNQYCAPTQAEARAKAGAGVALTQDPDVLDTWFSSGLWPIGTLGWPEDTAEMERYFPTSTLVTAHDILFFWVARMMMMQYATVGQRPFDTVYVHALVRDAQGRKMSKSLGNALNPLDLIDRYGADAVRFTMASMAAMGRDLKLSEPRIEGYRNFGTKLWQACRFAQMNGVWDGHRTDPTPPTTTLPATAWIVSQTARAQAAADAALSAYRFDDAANGLYAFVWGTVCDRFIEFAKPLLQQGDEAVAAEVRATLAWTLDRCTELLHPFMPFVTEAIWADTGARDGVLALSPWPDLPETLIDEGAEATIDWAIATIDGIRSARAQVGVPAGEVLPLLRVQSDDAARAQWDATSTLIARLARVSEMTDTDEAPKGALSIAVPGAAFAIPVAGVIDVAAETARLTKKAAKLGKEVAGLEKRLANPKFAASAPAEVVAEAEGNLAARREEAASIDAALARLADMA